MTAPPSVLLLLVALVVAPPLAAQDLAVRGDVVHTMAGDPIPNGVVVIEGGKIVAVGPAGSTPIPPFVEIVQAAVVIPGLVDAHATVGLTGVANQDHDQDQLDRSEPIQPELRAVDAYNARERLLSWVRSFGVTTVHTGHGPGALVAGQTLIAKTRGSTVDEAVLVPSAMLAATLGDGARMPGEGKAPGTRAKAVAMLRQALLDARTYADKREADDPEKRPDRDLRKEALARCVRGELPLLVTAHRHQDILAALRLADEFGLRLVLDGAADAHLVLDEIAAAGVPVIAHAPMMRTGGQDGETANASFETPALLHAAGIPFALQSGYEDYVPKVRVLLFEAAIAARYGLPFEEALAAVTISAARLLGVDDRVGSLEVGKDGDLALFDGDPFEYTSHCTGVIIEGRLASSTVR